MFNRQVHEDIEAMPMTGLNALLMSDVEVLTTLAVCAAACIMLMGLTPDLSRTGRAGVKLAVYTGLAMAVVAGLAWSSIPSPHVTAGIVSIAGG